MNKLKKSSLTFRLIIVPLSLLLIIVGAFSVWASRSEWSEKAVDRKNVVIQNLSACVQDSKVAWETGLEPFTNYQNATVSLDEPENKQAHAVVKIKPCDAHVIGDKGDLLTVTGTDIVEFVPPNADLPSHGVALLLAGCALIFLGVGLIVFTFSKSS